MVEFIRFNRQAKLPKADYYFEEIVEFEDILPYLLPPFNGEWVVNLVDIPIVDAKKLINTIKVPDYIKCNVIMQSNKLESILLERPDLEIKKDKPWDIFNADIVEMKNILDKNAAKYLYKALNGNIDELRKALKKLDEIADEPIITVNFVKKHYGSSQAVYASQVLEAFMRKERNRWSLYDKLTKELGIEYTYYALRKQVRKLMNDKAKYMSNSEDKTTVRYINKVDALFICYVYYLFSQSTSPYQLNALMWQIDNRSDDSFKRFDLC